MKHGYLIGLVVLLFVVLAFKTYEAFNASSGGALIQLARSHVPTSDEIQEAHQEEPFSEEIDNSPYAPY